MVANRNACVKIDGTTSHCIADATRPNPSSQHNRIHRRAHPVETRRVIYRRSNISRGNFHAESQRRRLPPRPQPSNMAETRKRRSVSPHKLGAHARMCACAHPAAQPANSALCRRTRTRVQFFAGMPQKGGHSQVIDFDDLGKRRNQGPQKARRASNPWHSRKKPDSTAEKRARTRGNPGIVGSAGLPSRGGARQKAPMPPPAFLDRVRDRS